MKSRDVPKFPPSFAKRYGPLSSFPSGSSKFFPNNVEFVKGNYVLGSDAAMELVRPLYDVILMLSITKWIHLNWGDEGLRRAFRRAFAELRPGGCLILEPQPWETYKKRLLTEEMWTNYQKVEMKPDAFIGYLTSQVGFALHELAGCPQHKSKNFRRPIHVFWKSPVPSSDLRCTSTETSPEIMPHHHQHHALGSISLAHYQPSTSYTAAATAGPCSSSSSTAASCSMVILKPELPLSDDDVDDPMKPGKLHRRRPGSSLLGSVTAGGEVSLDEEGLNTPCKSSAGSISSAVGSLGTSCFASTSSTSDSPPDKKPGSMASAHSFDSAGQVELGSDVGVGSAQCFSAPSHSVALQPGPLPVEEVDVDDGSDIGAQHSPTHTDSSGSSASSSYHQPIANGHGAIADAMPVLPMHEGSSSPEPNGVDEDVAVDQFPAGVVPPVLQELHYMEPINVALPDDGPIMEEALHILAAGAIMHAVEQQQNGHVDDDDDEDNDVIIGDQVME